MLWNHQTSWNRRKFFFLQLLLSACLCAIKGTVFPCIASFWIWPYVLWPLVTVHKSAETIQGRKLFKTRNYSRKYGTYCCSSNQNTALANLVIILKAEWTILINPIENLPQPVPQNGGRTLVLTKGQQKLEEQQGRRRTVVPKG